MRRLWLSVMAMCLATPAFALDPVVVEPPARTTSTPIVVYVTTGACGFPVPVVNVVGSRIDVDIELRTAICFPGTLIENTFPVHVGVVPAGDYTLTVRGGDFILGTPGGDGATLVDLTLVAKHRQ